MALSQVLQVGLRVNGAQDVIRALQSVGQAADNTASKINSTQKAMGAAAATMGGAIAVASLRAFENMERFRISMEAAAGSGAGSRIADEVQRIAAASAFGATELQDVARIWQSMTGQTGKTLQMVKALEALGALGGMTNEQLRGSGVAVSQLASSERVMGQDVLQLVNNGFPMAALLKELGVSSSRDLYGMESKKVIDAILKASDSPEAREAAARLSKLPTVQLQNALEAVNRALAPTGKLLGEVMAALAPLVTGIIGFLAHLNAVTNGWAGMITIVGLVGGGLYMMIGGMGRAVAALNALAAAATRAAVAQNAGAAANAAGNAAKTASKAAGMFPINPQRLYGRAAALNNLKWAMRGMVGPAGAVAGLTTAGLAGMYGIVKGLEHLTGNAGKRDANGLSFEDRVSRMFGGGTPQKSDDLERGVAKAVARQMG